VRGSVSNGLRLDSSHSRRRREVYNVPGSALCFRGLCDTLPRTLEDVGENTRKEQQGKEDGFYESQYSIRPQRTSRQGACSINGEDSITQRAWSRCNAGLWACASSVSPPVAYHPYLVEVPLFTVTLYPCSSGASFMGACRSCVMAVRTSAIPHGFRIHG
jgi:hypothetical protein